MNEIDRYVREVLRRLPVSAGEKSRVETDLRAHIEEALAAGESPAAALARLGTPDQVAEGFLAQMSMGYAGFWRRLAAFAIDILACLLAALPLGVVAIVIANLVPQSPEGFGYVVGVALLLLMASAGLGAMGVFLLYFPILEARFGQTLGKHALGLRVVKENGLPIGWREALLRRIPLYFEFIALDALFIPFTEKRQRAFDIVARTVVIQEQREQR